MICRNFAVDMKKKEKKKETRERKPNWKEYVASVDDIKAFLSDRIYLKHNVITGRVKYNGVRGYVVVCRSGDEIHAAQQSMAMQAADDSGSVDSSGQCF